MKMALMVLALGLNSSVPVFAKEQSKESREKKIITTRSGLKIEDLCIGSGAPAKKGDLVVITYGTAYLKNGKEIESLLRNRAKPFQFRLGSGSVIAGFDEGVTGTKRGGKRRLFIPANLAYGSRQGADFPPNSDLIIEFELIGLAEVGEPFIPKDSK